MIFQWDSSFISWATLKSSFTLLRSLPSSDIKLGTKLREFDGSFPFSQEVERQYVIPAMFKEVYSKVSVSREQKLASIV